MKKLYLACALAGAILLGLMVLVASADGPVVDLDAGEEDFRVVGFQALNFLGEVTSGDINGDGLDDLIIGASGFAATNPTRSNAGATYVFWGSSTRLSGTVNLDGGVADLEVYGPAPNHTLGRYVAAGDINDDGVEDLLMGADFASTDGYINNGAVYVLYGSSSLSGVIDLYTDTADLRVYGAATGDYLGRSIASCDVNADGVSDLIVGAYLADPGSRSEAGAVYVLFGSTSLSGTIELDSGGADFTILGDDAADRLGRSVACGDVDGDGTADIIAGAYLADQTWGDNAGEVYVVYGNSSLSGTLDLSTSSPDVLLRGVAGGDQAGFCVASGDINGDNTDDVLIGAYLADVDWPDSQTGAAYVVYGGSLSTTMNLSDTADITIYGAAEDDRLSRSLSSGDFNGDGYDDLLIGASWADRSETITNTGTSYVIYGAPEIAATIYLSDTDLIAIRVLGDDENDEAGRASGSGDLDGDGADDLIIGAVLAGGTDSGETYLIYGSSAMTLALSPASWTLTAGQSVTFTATASNKFGDWDITHEVNFSISSGAGGSWADNVYTSQRAGTWTVTGTFQSLVATATLTVNPGALDHIVICTDANGQSPAGDHTMTTDETWLLYAAGFDAHDNFIANQSVNWSVVGGIGTVAPGTGISTTLDATTPGTGYVHADHATATDDDTGAITVTVGAPSYITIRTAPNNGGEVAGEHTMTTDETWTLWAGGYDADDNFIANQSVAWSVVGGIGTVAPEAGISTTFDATMPGTGHVHADHATATDDDTGAITVTVGVLDHITICTDANGQSPAGEHTMTTDETWLLYAAGFDADDNFIANQSVNWSVVGGIGTVAPGTGTSTTFDATMPGTGHVHADHTTATDDDTGAITVTVGAPSYITIRTAPDNGGEVAGDHTMTTDETWTLWAGGYDADDNYIGDLSVMWTVTGGIGTATPATGISTTLDATTPGTGYVHADHGTATDDDTGTITVTAGAVARVELAPESATRTAGQPISYTLTAYDADNNAWDVTASGAYTIEAGAGGVWAASVYTTEVAGTWVVTGTFSGQSDTAGLTVTPAGMDHILILPVSATITAGQSQPYTAEARDAYGNFLEDVTKGTTFSISPAAGGVWADNVYTSEVAGTWTVTGTYGTYKDTATLIVLAGDPFTVTVTAHPERIDADGVSTSTITAFVTDEYGNPVQDGTEVTFASDLGSVSPTNVGTVNGLAQTTLTASAVPGRATVTAAAGSVVGETHVSMVVRCYLPLVFRAWSSP